MDLEEQVAALSARVEDLERRLHGVEVPAVARTGLDPAPPVRPMRSPSADSAPTPAVQPPPPVLGGPSPAPALRPAWMSTETLLKWSGLGLVVLAAIFFVGTAISRGWIGPEIQLAGATLGGLGLIYGGFHLINANRPWAAALASGGAVVVAVCAAAANGGLDLIDEYPALVLLAVVTVAVGWVSRRLSVELVASVAGLAAAFLPLWIVEDVDLPPLVLAGWMAILALAATAFGWYQGWRASRLFTVVAAGLVLFGLTGAGAEDLSTAERYIALIVIGAVAALAWSGPAYPELAAKTGQERWRSLDHRVVLSLPLWAWGITALAADVDTDRSGALLGFAIATVFGLLVLVAWSRLPTTLATSHVLGTGMLVAVSLAALTSGPGLLVALAVQGAATALLARLFNDRWLLAFAGLLGSIAVGWAALSTMGGIFDGLPFGQLMANLLVVALLVGGAYWSRRRSDDQLALPLTVLSWIAVLAWIASAFGHQAQGQVIVSLLWSALAGAALVYGVKADDKVARQLGIVTLIVVLVKLLTVDLAEVDTLWRVGLFLVVGGGLLRLGYVLPRLSRVEDSQLR